MWGDLPASVTIIINRLPYLIRNNLVSFLEKVCHDAENFFLVDAICFDQEHTLERNHQVQLMSAIYKNAESVLLWLGDATTDSDFVMTILADYGRHIFCYSGSCAILDRSKDSLGSGICIEAHRFITGYQAPLKSPYWKRVGIVQEVMFARCIWIMCGQYRVDWEAVFSALLRIAGHSCSARSH
jgi:hypothetical protein